MSKTLLDLFKTCNYPQPNKNLDKTPVSDDTKNNQVDTAGIFYKDTTWKFGVNYSKGVDTNNDKTPVSDEANQVDTAGIFYKDTTWKFGVNYSKGVDTNIDITPISDDANQVDTAGIFYKDTTWKFGVNYSLDYAKPDTTLISDQLNNYQLDRNGAYLARTYWPSFIALTNGGFQTPYDLVKSIEEKNAKFTFFNNVSVFGKKIGDKSSFGVLKNKVPPIFSPFLDRISADTDSKSIRLTSLVELNNPMIYGSDTLRITSRGTPITNLMKQDSLNSNGNLSLNIGPLISKIQSGVGKILGLPTPTIPTYVKNYIPTGNIKPLIAENVKYRASHLIEIRDGSRGSALGQVLSNAKGNPSDMIGNLANAAFGKAKRAITDAIIGGINEGRGVFSNVYHQFDYSVGDKYTDKVGKNTIFGNPADTQLDDFNGDGDWPKEVNGIKIDAGKFSDTTLPGKVLNKLSGVKFEDIPSTSHRLSVLKTSSPIFGICRLTDGVNVFDGRNEYGASCAAKYSTINASLDTGSLPVAMRQEILFGSGLRPNDDFVNIYGPAANITGNCDFVLHPIYSGRTCEYTSHLWQSANLGRSNTFISDGFCKGFWGEHNRDTNISGSVTVNNNVTVGNTSAKDDKYSIVPFWIKDERTSEAFIFKTTIQSITETFTPDWQPSNFVGNPYKYYTYTGIERTIAFDLLIYTESPEELYVNWERLKYLGGLVYPKFGQNKKLITPPIFKFRIGDLYKGRYGIFETLTYTIVEDNGWESVTNSIVPKHISVNISIKFLEDVGAEDKLYDFNINVAGIKALVKNRSDFITTTRDNIRKEVGNERDRITDNIEVRKKATDFQFESGLDMARLKSKFQNQSAAKLVETEIKTPTLGTVGAASKKELRDLKKLEKRRQ